jgi:hypothetical protein
LARRINVEALGEIPLSGRGASDAPLTNGLLAAAYRAIREGLGLRFRGRPLAGCLEMLDPESLHPYFLGHAYLHAMQRCLAHANQEYESAEKFIGLIMRILRSSQAPAAAAHLFQKMQSENLRLLFRTVSPALSLAHAAFPRVVEK